MQHNWRTAGFPLSKLIAILRPKCPVRLIIYTPLGGGEVSQGHWQEVKREQPSPRFELSLLISMKKLMYYEWGSLKKFQDFFRMGTFIDSTHKVPFFRMGTFIDSTHKVPFEVISSGCNALVVPFQQLLQGPMEVL